jgi:hypothetical protein
MAAHAAACAEWDAGRGVDRGPSCATLGDGSVWTGTGYGIGTYEFDCDCDEQPEELEELPEDIRMRLAGAPMLPGMEDV